APAWAAAVDPSHLQPHVKLLQLMDALSLLVSFGAQEERLLTEIPRRNWDDRATLAWRPSANRGIVCEPYPFDSDPLEVFLPVRVLPAGWGALPFEAEMLPLTRLHAAPLRMVRFELS